MIRVWTKPGGGGGHDGMNQPTMYLSLRNCLWIEASGTNVLFYFHTGSQPLGLSDRRFPSTLSSHLCFHLILGLYISDEAAQG